MYDSGTAKLRAIYTKDPPAEKANMCSFCVFLGPFFFPCFPLSTSVKQSSASSCDLLNSPFHQNEIGERATWRRSKVEALDENREGSWISLAVTKHYKVIHSPAVRGKKEKEKKKKGNKPATPSSLQYHQSTISSKTSIQNYVLPLS